MVENHENGMVTLIGSDGGKIKLKKIQWTNFLIAFTRHIRLGKSRLNHDPSCEIYFGSASLQRMSKRIDYQSASNPKRLKQLCGR